MKHKRLSLWIQDATIYCGTMLKCDVQSRRVFQKHELFLKRLKLHIVWPLREKPLRFNESACVVNNHLSDKSII